MVRDMGDAPVRFRMDPRGGLIPGPEALAGLPGGTRVAIVRLLPPDEGPDVSDDALLSTMRRLVADGNLVFRLALREFGVGLPAGLTVEQAAEAGERLTRLAVPPDGMAGRYPGVCVGIGGPIGEPADVPPPTLRPALRSGMHSARTPGSASGSPSSSAR